jgi:hypothetical protein
MSTGQTRIVRLFGLVLLLLTSGAIGIWSAVPARVAAADAKDSKVKALLKERHATLQEIASQTTKEYHTGKASFAQFCEANRASERRTRSWTPTRSVSWCWRKRWRWPGNMKKLPTPRSGLGRAPSCRAYSSPR